MKTTTAATFPVHFPPSDVLTLDAPIPADGNDHVETVGDAEVDLVDALVEAADFVLYQMQVALRFVLSRADARRAVLEVFDDACGRGVAGRGAVGAVAVIVDLARAGDAEGIARTIVQARHQFGDDELFSASAALIAAWTDRIAAELALDASEVHTELSAR